MVNRKLVSGAFALACCSSALLSASAAQAANFSAEYVLASIRKSAISCQAGRDVIWFFRTYERRSLAISIKQNDAVLLAAKDREWIVNRAASH